MRKPESFTTDEKAIAALIGTTALVLGMWIGVWIVPDVALDVPTETSYTSTGTVHNALYTPTPNFLPGLTVLLLVGAGWYTYTLYKADADDADALDDVDTDHAGAPADD